MDGLWRQDELTVDFDLKTKGRSWELGAECIV
jgi:hypothetical protein